MDQSVNETGLGRLRPGRIEFLAGLARAPDARGGEKAPQGIQRVLQASSSLAMPRPMLSRIASISCRRAFPAYRRSTPCHDGAGRPSSRPACPAVRGRGASLADCSTYVRNRSTVTSRTALPSRALLALTRRYRSSGISIVAFTTTANRIPILRSSPHHGRPPSSRSGPPLTPQAAGRLSVSSARISS